MTASEQAKLRATHFMLGQSNLPRECKAVLQAALAVYTALMELEPDTWDSSRWVDPYRRQSWVDAYPPVECGRDDDTR